jgi:hypothetical protein
MRPSYDSISHNSESYESDQSRTRLIPNTSSSDAEDPETEKEIRNRKIDQEDIAPYEVSEMKITLLKFFNKIQDYYYFESLKR